MSNFREDCDAKRSINIAGALRTIAIYQSCPILGRTATKQKRSSWYQGWPFLICKSLEIPFLSSSFLALSFRRNLLRRVFCPSVRNLLYRKSAKRDTQDSFGRTRKKGHHFMNDDLFFVIHWKLIINAFKKNNFKVFWTKCFQPCLRMITLQIKKKVMSAAQLQTNLLRMILEIDDLNVLHSLMIHLKPFQSKPKPRADMSLFLNSFQYKMTNEAIDAQLNEMRNEWERDFF